MFRNLFLLTIIFLFVYFVNFIIIVYIGKCEIAFNYFFLLFLFVFLVISAVIYPKLSFYAHLAILFDFYSMHLEEKIENPDTTSKTEKLIRLINRS